jgi:hypothetical protein
MSLGWHAGEEQAGWQDDEAERNDHEECVGDSIHWQRGHDENQVLTEGSAHCCGRHY